MANVFDYLNWRGDLSLQQDEFNEIDNLILSRLAFIPFDGVVTESFDKGISISDAADIIGKKKASELELNMKKDLKLLKAAAKSNRFCHMRLCGYINHLDSKTQKQFSAISIELDGDSFYLAYRGTDKTIVGWKEDFNMSFMPSIPAQIQAVSYLEEAASHFKGKFIVGGHSKGGNLAVYAAAFCSKILQARVERIYNNDGPGFHSEIISHPGYLAIKHKIHTFVPQTSVVGMLLEHEEEYVIVHSTQTGLMQHDLYSWRVQGKHLIYLDTITNSSKFIDKTLKGWIARMTPEQRGQFSDALYSILSSTEARTFTDLGVKWHENALLMLKSVVNMDDSMRQAISQALSSLLKSAKSNLPPFRFTFLNKLKK